MECGIALGSNAGDRAGHLRAGVAALRTLGRVTAVSRVYETAPVDCPPGSGAFLNAVAVLEWEGTPEALLERLQAVETAQGREAVRPRNAPRTLDLDILYAGTVVRNPGPPVLPHPALHLRRFVLQPLADVRPDLVLPGHDEPVSALLAALPADPATPVEYPLSLADPVDRAAAFRALKSAGRRAVCLTAADYPTARLLDETGVVDLILAGDSLGMVELGYPDTVEVTLAEMVHHTRAVRRGVVRSFLGSDLPFHTYRTPEEAVENARALMAAGADAVKLEGGVAVVPQVRAILDAGIPVIGHIGMLPQSVRDEGGYRKKGRTPEDARRLLDDAVALDACGVCAIVLEGIAAEAAREITLAIRCPSIGIGSGPDCDGQILVTADLIGLFPWFRPPFAKARADVAAEIRRAVNEFAGEVRRPEETEAAGGT